MEKPFKCRRRKIGGPRFVVNVDVQFLSLTAKGIGIEGLGVIRNLSMRGALIETHAVVTTNDQLTLQMTLPNQAAPVKIPTVAVRWTRGHQAGIEFLKLETDTSRQLMKYLSGIHNAARLQRSGFAS